MSGHRPGHTRPRLGVDCKRCGHPIRDRVIVQPGKAWFNHRISGVCDVCVEAAYQRGIARAMCDDPEIDPEAPRPCPGPN